MRDVGFSSQTVWYESIPCTFRAQFTNCDMRQIHKICDMSPTYKHCNLGPFHKQMAQILIFVDEDIANANLMDTNVNDKSPEFYMLQALVAEQRE